MRELDAAAAVRVLNKYRVDFVVIGGMAAQLHDLPVPATVDIDVTPSGQRANLERLAKAFDELEAGLYSADEAGTWFPRVPVENWKRSTMSPRPGRGAVAVRCPIGPRATRRRHR